MQTQNGGPWLDYTVGEQPASPKLVRILCAGIIRPSFFLLPLATGDHVGIQVQEDGETQRKRGALQVGNWKDDEWPPKHLVHDDGPATWAEEGPYGYRTPIYMLDHIIRLQAVLKKLFGGWGSTSGGFKTLMRVVFLIWGAGLILSCLASLVIRSVSSLIEAMVERKTATHVMMWWNYKPLNQEEAL